MLKVVRIKELSIDYCQSILFAVKQMDLVKSKLLMVTKSGKFFSLLSIGDVQRAIIRQIEMDSPIRQIIRKNSKITVAKNKMSKEEIRKLFFEARAEFMPVIDENGNLIDVHFWKDHFNTNIPRKRGLSKLPVVVMAGGKGSRLKPITNIIPKALLPIDDKPILELIKDRFESYGVENFFFMLNYKHEMIENHFNKLQNINSIEYILEKKTIRNCRKLEFAC